MEFESKERAAVGEIIRIEDTSKNLSLRARVMKCEEIRVGVWKTTARVFPNASSHEPK